MTIEFVLLGVVLCRILISDNLQHYFRSSGSSYHTSSGMALDYGMILLGLCDALYVGFFPTARCRIAPFVRFGLAISIPWVQNVVVSFMRVSVSISTIGLFLLGTIIAFAWLAAMIFDDVDMKDQYGLEIGLGFDSFGKALYTMFVTMTTGNLPDFLVPSYAYNRLLLFFWVPFLLLAVCVFTQVVLATVYNAYQDDLTERVKAGHEYRVKGINAAFDYIKETAKFESSGAEQHMVCFDTFVALVRRLRVFSASVTIDENLVRIVFEALDDNKDNMLTSSEFRDMCEVLMTRFRITRRDSLVRKRLEGTQVGALLRRLMENGSQGPDLGVAPPTWTTPKFAGSPFDCFTNVVFGCNVLWLILESVYDLNDIPSEIWFSSVDLSFSFLYVFEVCVKLSWWTFEEYWMSGENRFDFVTTWILAGAGVAVLLFDVDGDVIRYLNLLRVLRLLKALSNIPVYKRTVATIYGMVSAWRCFGHESPGGVSLECMGPSTLWGAII